MTLLSLRGQAPFPGVSLLLLLLLMSYTLATLPTSSWSVTLPKYPCDPSGMTAGLPFCNNTLPVEARARDLVSRLNLTEKVQQLVNGASAVPRLEIPAYLWWSEALHGVSNLGPATRFDDTIPGATMFPQVIHTAASFNASLWNLIGQAVSTEARAMHNVGLAGLTFWSPNVNIFRDPRWGRGQETPGEDPFVVSVYAVNYVRGLQTVDDYQDYRPERLKVAACCKHYTAYDLDNWNGIQRYTFNAMVTEQDLEDTFDPPFKNCVEKGGVASVMCSYNQVNGIPTCANPQLLNATIRGSWNLYGYIVSDCDSVDVFFNQQKYTATAEDAAALALNAGLDLNCGSFLAEHTEAAVNLGKVPESRVDDAVTKNFMVLMRLGWFDGNPATQNPYGTLGPSDVCTDEHRELALEAARQGLVLLLNRDGVLPLSQGKVSTLAVVGPNSNVTTTMIGNYAGIACKYTTPLDGISSYVNKTLYAPGCQDVLCAEDSLIADAVTEASQADATILVVGADQTLEAEALDRSSLLLPGHQQHLVSAVANASPGAVIMVVMSGGPFDISFAIGNPKISAIIWVGYPGELGGQAIADAIFGAYNPSGKLPVTWYPEEFTKIPMTIMNMRPDPSTGYPGRTHRFYTGPTIFPFGYGLSYTTFSYHLQKLSLNNKQSCLFHKNGLCRAMLVDPQTCKEGELFMHAKVVVRNEGDKSGDEVVMAFHVPAWPTSDGAPLRQLVAFERVHVPPSRSKMVRLSIDVCRDMATADVKGGRTLKGGLHGLHVGDIRVPLHMVFMTPVNLK